MGFLRDHNASDDVEVNRKNGKSIYTFNGKQDAKIYSFQSSW